MAKDNAFAEEFLFLDLDDSDLVAGLAEAESMSTASIAKMQSTFDSIGDRAPKSFHSVTNAAKGTAASLQNVGTVATTAGGAVGQFAALSGNQAVAALGQVTALGGGLTQFFTSLSGGLVTVATIAGGVIFSLVNKAREASATLKQFAEDSRAEGLAIGVGSDATRAALVAGGSAFELAELDQKRKIAEVTNKQIAIESNINLSAEERAAILKDLAVEMEAQEAILKRIQQAEATRIRDAREHRDEIEKTSRAAFEALQRKRMEVESAKDLVRYEKEAAEVRARNDIIASQNVDRMRAGLQARLAALSPTSGGAGFTSGSGFTNVTQAIGQLGTPNDPSTQQRQKQIELLQAQLAKLDTIKDNIGAGAG